MKTVLSDKEREKLSFLIVDDDGQVREILDGYLRKFGFSNITHAKDGRAALRIVQSRHQAIDFVISDWEMPHIDGLTLLRAIRKDPFRKDVKFIMVTSQVSRERMKITKAAKSHVDAYVVKPFRAHILQQKISNLLNGIIDESVQEFENELLPEVPSNKMALPKKPKGNIGQVFLDKETKGAGVLVNMKTNKSPVIGTVKKAAVKKVEAAPQLVLPPDEEIKNEHIDLVLRLSKSYLKVKWFDKAITLCLEAVEMFPESADVFACLARSYFMKGDYESADLHLKKALRLRPYHVESLTLIDEIATAKKAAA